MQSDNLPSLYVIDVFILKPLLHACVTVRFDAPDHLLKLNRLKVFQN